MVPRLVSSMICGVGTRLLKNLFQIYMVLLALQMLL
jgi:hypothetical protein